MDAYTLHLLGMAVEATHCLDVWEHSAGWTARFEASYGDAKGRTAHAFSDALAALLTDLGVEVPEPASVAGAADWEEGNVLDERVEVDAIRSLYARDRLTALAWLEAS